MDLPVSLRHEFPSEWHNFLNPQKDSQGPPTLIMNTGRERLPFLFQDRPIIINKIEMFLKIRPIFAPSHNETTLRFTLQQTTDPPENEHELGDLNPWNGLLRASKSAQVRLEGELGNWTITGRNVHEKTPDGHINPNAIEDILVVFEYTLS